MDINANLDAGNNPVGKTFESGKGKKVAAAAQREEIAAKKAEARREIAAKKAASRKKSPAKKRK